MKFNFEQLVAASLLKFGSIDGFSLLFLTRKAEEDIRVNYQRSDLNSLIGLIESKNGVLHLKEGVSLDSTLSDGMTILERLNTIAGGDVLTYLEIFDYRELILRKALFSSLGGMQCSFNNFENDLKEKLQNEGYIASYADEEKAEEEEEITFRAQAYLFMIDNKSQINEFSKALASVSVRTDLIESYLAYVLNCDSPDDYKLSFKDITGYQNFVQEHEFCIHDDEGRK